MTTDNSTNNDSWSDDSWQQSSAPSKSEQSKAVPPKEPKTASEAVKPETTSPRPRRRELPKPEPFSLDFMSAPSKTANTASFDEDVKASEPSQSKKAPMLDDATGKDSTEPNQPKASAEPEDNAGWGKTKKRKGAADIAFVIDVTGSMSPCINALKGSIKHFLQELAHGTEDIKPVEDWRARIVGYRDYPADKDSSYRWLNDFEFTRDTDVLVKQLDSLKAIGGGDEPESLLDAISVIMDAGELPKDNSVEINDKRWRSRSQAAHIMVVFTDASFHETMSVPGHEGETYDDLNDRLTAFRMNGFLFVPGTEQYETTFGETSKMVIRDCGRLDDADGLRSVMSNPEKLRDILLRLQRGISSSSQAW